MKVYNNPNSTEWPQLLSRPTENLDAVEQRVAAILAQVKTGGDEAIKTLTREIDGVALDNLSYPVGDYSAQVSAELKTAIATAQQNIETFHRAQLETPVKIETMPGVTCWRQSVAIERVGLYIPGGSAPLFSTLLMLAIPARVAGCKELVVCTPPQKSGEKLNSVIGYVCQVLGIEKVHLVGGAQAIAAMTYGTETIPKVDKIFGPGNSYVTLAKQLAQKEGVAIDMPAGPSEVLVIADETSNPEFVAADLLSQAEHGADSQVILVSTSEDLVKKVADEIEQQVRQLPREKIARKALENSRAFVVADMETAFDISNAYAPEHLILAIDDAENWLDKIVNAGSVFVGKYACESAGDYASGTNHTLPTNGYAQAYSGVSLDSFLKKITFQTISARGIQTIGPAIEEMASAESLIGHKNAVSVRLREIVKSDK